MISSDVRTATDRCSVEPAGAAESETGKRVFVHYWGSHFKSLRQVRDLGLRFRVLVEKGWRCHLVLERMPDDDTWLNELHELGVTVKCIKRPKSNFDQFAIRRIRDYCLETHCDTILCDNIHMSPLIGAAWAGVPLRFWSKRAMNSHFEQCRRPSLKERIAISTRLSGRLSTKVLAVSRSVADELECSGVPREKILVHPNPRPEMSLIHRSRNEMRAELGYEEKDIVLVSIGRMEKVKGWDLLVDAFLKQASVYPNAKLLLVGSCNIKGQEAFKQEVERIIGDSDYGDRIRFQGHHQDVQSMLTAGDVYVLPSRSEGFCIALLEALEVGLPVVASNVGVAAEVIENNQCGIVVPRNCVRSLSLALGRILSDETLRTVMAERAHVPDSIPDRLSHARRFAEIFENSSAR